MLKRLFFVFIALCLLFWGFLLFLRLFSLRRSIFLLKFLKACRFVICECWGVEFHLSASFFSAVYHWKNWLRSWLMIDCWSRCQRFFWRVSWLPDWVLWRDFLSLEFLSQRPSWLIFLRNLILINKRTEIKASASFCWKKIESLFQQREEERLVFPCNGDHSQVAIHMSDEPGWA